jgi:subtilisin family serine protease
VTTQGSPSEGDWRSQVSARVADEVDYIQNAFAGTEPRIQIGVATVPNGGLDYLYSIGYLLVRAEFLRDVVGILGKASGLEDDAREEAEEEALKKATPLIEGVAQVPIGGFRLSVPDALDRVDDALEEGIATPDQVFTVANGSGGEVGVCPATEPQEVYERCGPFPFPPVCPGDRGGDVKIYLGDTGLLEEVYNDSGWLSDHTWMTGVQLAPNPDGSLPDPDPLGPVLADGTQTILPYEGHGTFVAGVARCMAPKVEILVADVFKIAGSALESQLVPKLRAALALDVDMFHLTVAATTRKDIHPIAFAAWLTRLHQLKGVICVAAAGNNGSSRRCWPAAFPEVISVGALATDWRSRARFSNFGRWVDVYAPGTNLVNAYTEGDYECKVRPYEGTHRRFTGLAEWSGTSFSTPIVTGLIAARMSRTHESARDAASALLRMARAQVVPGTGPILVPCCGAVPRCGRCCAEHPCACGTQPDQ